jgi:chaperone modulatory protein CbpM
METREFLVQAQLEPETLEAFIEAGWLLPRGELANCEFSDLDVARAQLIRDLRQALGVNDEGIPIVLHLVDQLHGMRRILREVLSTMAEREQERDAR